MILGYTELHGENTKTLREIQLLSKDLGESRCWLCGSLCSNEKVVSICK